VRRRAIVHGHVQGVFFRDSVQRLADRLGVAGWVRNNWDGTVEAVLEGEGARVDQVVEFMRNGPRGARVDGIQVADEDSEGLSGFEVR
jgi:acylphosphatase